MGLRLSRRHPPRLAELRPLRPSPRVNPPQACRIDCAMAGAPLLQTSPAPFLLQRCNPLAQPDQLLRLALELLEQRRQFRKGGEFA